jgi:CYTH domain-containing protein/CHAD domain-containing protein
MAFQLRPMKHVGRGVKQVERERIDDALARLDRLEGCSPEQIEEQVHEIRKRCKEARGLARIVRPALGDEFDRFNRLVGDAATELSSIRDAHAVLVTLDHLRSMPHDDVEESFAPVRAGQAELAREATDGLRAGDPRLERASALLTDARRRIKLWDLPQGFDPIADGLGETYRRGARAFKRAVRQPTDDRMHEWRKSVKHLWYQVRLLQPAAPSVLGNLSDVLDGLADALGDDHDLAVLVEHLAAEPERFGASASMSDVECAAREQQDDLRARSFRLASTVYAEPRSAFVARIRTYWDTTLAEGPERPTGGIGALVADLDRTADDPRRARGATGIERERKYLVTLPIELSEGTPLRQGYVAIDGALSVRVRDAGPDGCTLTLKAGSGASRIELEWPIERARFDELWRHTKARRISKTRSADPLGDHIVEVDVFHDELSGLVIAEVEFDDDASMAVFTPPTWFGPDVTDDVRYTNASMAMNGLDPRLFTSPTPNA